MSIATLDPPVRVRRTPTTTLAGVLLIVMATLFAGVGQASAAVVSGRVSQAQQTASILAAGAHHDLSLIKDGPILTAQQVRALAHTLATAATAMAVEQARVNALPGIQPNISIGFGWSIYMRFSPEDQHFVLIAGTAGLISLVCFVSAGTACAIAGFAGATVIAWIASYDNWACWVEKLSYNGNVQGVNPYWRC